MATVVLHQRVYIWRAGWLTRMMASFGAKARGSMAVATLTTKDSRSSSPTVGALKKGTLRIQALCVYVHWFSSRHRATVRLWCNVEGRTRHTCDKRPPLGLAGPVTFA